MRYNYNYGKLENGTLVYAPNKLIIGTDQVFNASEETYRENGYLPVVNTEQPKSTDGFYYSPVYVEQNASIVQQWESTKSPKSTKQPRVIISVRLKIWG